MSTDVSQLRALAVDLGKASAKGTILAARAIRKTALDIQADAQVLAPVDTGALRNSIGVTMSGPLAAEIGPTVHYAIYNEFGTHKMPARPFMGPAFDRRSPGLEQALGQIADGIL